MKKNNIREEVLRIHELTYGKKYLTENNDEFLNKILKILGIDNLNLSTIKSEKTDYLTNNVDDFYETLNDAVVLAGFPLHSLLQALYCIVLLMYSRDCLHLFLSCILIHSLLFFR